MNPVLGIVASLALTAVAVAAGCFLGATGGASTFHPTHIELALSLVVAVATLVTLLVSFTRSVTARIAVAAALLAIDDGLLCSHLAGRWPFSCDPFHDNRYVSFLVVVVLATVYGLVRKRLWARWIGLAFGAFGLLSTGMNALAFVRAGERDDWTWIFCTLFLGAAAVGINLADRRVATAFLERSGQRALWQSTDSLVRVTRWALIANVAGTSMLLVYAWTQPFVSGTANRALALAAMLGLGSILVMLRKTVGGFVLGLGGAALAAFLASIARAGSNEPELVRYYAVFWVPASLLGMLCGAMMVQRASRRSHQV